MRVSKVDVKSDIHFGAFSLSDKDARIVNSYMKRYQYKPSQSVKNNIVNIYDKYIKKEAEASEQNIISADDYAQSLFLKLLRLIETYKKLPTTYKPESYLTGMLNAYKPTANDLAMFDGEFMISSDSMTHKDYIATH